MNINIKKINPGTQLWQVIKKIYDNCSPDLLVMPNTTGFSNPQPFFWHISATLTSYIFEKYIYVFK